MPVDFQYAHQMDYTVRLIAAARQTPSGLILSVRPSLIANSTILASVRGPYNAVWVRGQYGQDTFYYGRGAGAQPTGVAVVSDLMRVAREIRSGSPARVSPFAHERLGEYEPISIERLKSPYYLRFRVEDKPGIIARLAAALAAQGISIDAVLQLPEENWRDLPFVITTQPTTEESLRAALKEMSTHDYLIEAPFAMPMEARL
jgi:homoserine dehydrogenase